MGTKYRDKLSEQYHRRVEERMHSGDLPVPHTGASVSTSEEVQEFHIGRLKFGSRRAGKIRVIGGKVIVRIAYYSKKTVMEIASEVLAGAMVLAIILLVERASHWHFVEFFLELFGRNNK